MIRHSPYHHKMLATGATMGDRLSFAAPLVYSTTCEEHEATRTAVGIFDVYYQVAVEIVGSGAEDLVQILAVNDISRMHDGMVVYSCLCNEDGGMVDDLTILRLSKDRFWLCPTPSRVMAVKAHIERYGEGCSAWTTNLGYKNAYLSIQGPRSRDLMRKITDADVSSDALPYFRFTWGNLRAVPDAMISRTGYSGELGYEVFYASEYAEYLWDEVFKAGEEFGVRPCGLGALRTLRMEKRYPLYGLDVDETTSPFEAGLGWTVKLDKGRFIGREALLKQSQSGVTRKLALLKIDDIDAEIAIGDVVQHDDGEATIRSAEKAYTCGVTLAMAYLPASVVSEGHRVRIQGSNGDAYAAAVHLRSVYDAAGERVRS